MATEESDPNDSQVRYEPYHGEEIDLNAADILQEFVDRGLIGDKYKELTQLAQGGMGVIYKVHDVGLERAVVLKVINPEAISNADLFTRFVEEARITGQLEHPNIIPVHDIGVMGGDQLYFSMKLIEGRELRQILEELRTSDPEAEQISLFSLLTIFRKVCNAVAFAHSRRIIHRDIKPDNIMVGNYGEVLLVDWGLARRLDQPEKISASSFDSGFFDEHGSGSVTKTRDGIIKGTPAYMAPEMARGEVDKVDIRSDVFLLGSTLYAIATLETPYSDEGPDDVYKILQRAEAGEFMRPGERAPERQVPEELEEIITKAMSFNPGDRYQTVADLSAEVDALIEGRGQSKRRFFPPGKHLMKEGEKGEEAYVIVSGEVEVYKTIDGKHVSLVHLKPGATVGEMALIDDSLRSASVVALHDTVVMVITAKIMKENLKKMPPWMGQTIGSLAERLRETNADIHPLLRGDCVYQVMSFIRYLYPFCGVAATEPKTRQTVIALDAEKILLEISTQLCIGPGKVLGVIGNLLETGLIQSLGENNFTIPNFDLFCQFVEYVRGQLGQPTGTPTDPLARLVSGENELLIAFARPGAEGGIAASCGEVEQIPPEEVLGCASAAKVPECFPDLLSRLQDSGEK